MWTISLPLSVVVSSKKNFTLNLNKYRNTHFLVLNRAKVEFARVVSPLLKQVPKLDQCTLEYIYFPGSNRVVDTNNVCSVVDKFFADTLVSCGVLHDDGPKYLLSTTYRPGGVDKHKPRVDVIIRSAHALPEGNNRMKASAVFIIEPHEVQQALQNFFRKQYPQTDSTEKLEFKSVGDGSYETRSTLDLSKVVSGTAVTSEPASPTVPLTTRPEPRVDLQAAPSATAKVTPSPGPTPLETQPAAGTKAPEKVEAEPDLPPVPPKKAGLFDDFVPVPSQG